MTVTWNIMLMLCQLDPILTKQKKNKQDKTVANTKKQTKNPKTQG